MKFLLIVLTIVAFVLMLFYLYIAFVGKMISTKTKTSDRFIWTSLKLKKTNDENANFKSATIFLDEKNLYITKHNIFQINSLLAKKKYSEFITIPLNSISKFEYTNVHKNVGSKLIVALFNKLFIRNSFVLEIEYLNEYGQDLSYELVSGNLRSEDFEAIYIDIDHKIYKSRVALLQERDDNTKHTSVEKEEVEVENSDETKLNPIKEDDTKSEKVVDDETVLIHKKSKKNDEQKEEDSENTNKLN